MGEMMMKKRMECIEMISGMIYRDPYSKATGIMG